MFWYFKKTLFPLQISTPATTWINLTHKFELEVVLRSCRNVTLSSFKQNAMSKDDILKLTVVFWWDFGHATPKYGTLAYWIF